MAFHDLPPEKTRVLACDADASACDAFYVAYPTDRLLLPASSATNAQVRYKTSNEVKSIYFLQTGAGMKKVF
jgi:hypothetical protein